MDEHALAVDIRCFEGVDLRDPHPGSIGGDKNRSVFGGSNNGKEDEGVLHLEDYGKSFGSIGEREMLPDSPLAQGDPVEKLEGRRVSLLQSWSDFPFLGEME
jgi:hypothetical protein